jgi:hypothetical protein
MRAVTVTSLLAAIAMIAHPVAADEQPDQAAHPDCGDVILEDTTLTRDLECDGDGLQIGADGVTLDLNGHTIRQVGVHDRSVGILVQCEHWGSPHCEGPTWVNDVNVVNGTVSGFWIGLHLDFANRIQIEHMHLDGDHLALAAYQSNPFFLHHSTLDGDVNMLYVTGRVSHNTIKGTLTGTYFVDVEITDNRFRGGGIGWIGHEIGKDVLIARNHIQGALVGVHTEGRAEIIDNHIVNAGVGIYVGFRGAVTVRGNRIVGTDGAGIYTSTISGSHPTIASNTVINTGRNPSSPPLLTGAHSSTDGIHVRTEGWSSVPDHAAVIRDNRVTRTRGHGIYVDEQVTVLDGDGNRVRAASADPACVGVPCR